MSTREITAVKRLPLAQQRPREMRIVWLGDSLTAGMFNSENKYPPGHTLQKLLDKKCGSYWIRNAARGSTR